MYEECLQFVDKFIMSKSYTENRRKERDSMKKYGVGWIVLDAICFFIELLGVLSGKADKLDYVFMWVSGFFLVSIIGLLICSKVQKNKRRAAQRASERSKLSDYT
jgi:hypothetical protein